MTVKPNPWHIVEVGNYEGTPFGAAHSPAECGCTPKEPCQTLQLYYAHPGFPTEDTPAGLYRMRTNAFGMLEVQRAVDAS